MKLYTTEELASAATYAADAALATMGRQVAWVILDKLPTDQRCPVGELKARVLAGQYPDEMRAAVYAAWESTQAQAGADDANRQLVAAIHCDGYSFEVDGKSILVRGPWDEDLHSRIKRQKGHWEGADSRQNRKLWSLPLSAAPSLARVLANFQIARAKRLKTESETRAAKQTADAQRQAEQKAKWAAADAAESRRNAAVAAERDAAESARRAKATASRVKVRAGKHSRGAHIADASGTVRPITGFGAAWSETVPDPAWGNHGVRYDEPCGICGRESEIDNETECCERCAGGDSVRVCYAYFE